MHRLPQRTSLVAQTVEVLREAMRVGEWPRWLPGEHELSRRLHVSRVTLRAALLELEREKCIRGGQGRRREILKLTPEASVGPSPQRTVVMLAGLPMHQMPNAAVLWVDKLREHLAEAGWLMEYHESAAALRREPGPALLDLQERLRPAVWILYRSTLEMQRWFSERHLPVVLAGSPHPGTELSSVDVDFSACCRHAAGRMTAFGHEHLAIIRPDSRNAGDIESVVGFETGAAGRKVTSLLHQGSVSSLALGLEKLMSAKPRPTALFVFHVPHLLTVLGWLQQQGFSVPRDVSVVCRDHDPLLEHMLPTPTHYAPNMPLFARKLSRKVMALLTGEAAAAKAVRIMPNFIRGGTLERH
ncbi:MAG: substrate-binding domain-containing protein [Verrucomicrobium sp.]|nr:substrate-binding domain-containing protein [Verrucomicrobium sp.]